MNSKNAIDQNKLLSICEKAKNDFFAFKEEELYESVIKELPLSVYYKKRKKEIVGQLDYDLMLLFIGAFNKLEQTTWLLEKREYDEYGHLIIEKLCEDIAYIYERETTIIFIIRVSPLYEALTKTALSGEQKEDETHYSISSDLLEKYLSGEKPKSAHLIAISHYGIGLGSSFMTKRYHFDEYIKWSNPKFAKNSLSFKIAEDTYNSLRLIDKYTKEDFYKINPKRFITKLLSLIVEEQNTANFKVVYNKVIECITSSEYSKDIVASFISYLHEMASLTTVKDESLFDFTQVALGLFKAAEIIFYDLLIKKWQGFNYTINKNGELGYKDITIREKTTLGDLSRIFYSIDDGVRRCLRKSDYRQTKAAVDDWINYDRNDHLHKDIMEAKKDLMNSLDSTINVIFDLVEMFY